MAAPANPQPRNPPPGRRRPPPHHGRWLWLILALAFGLGIWLLMKYFPGGLDSEGEWMELTRLVAILALVSSALLFTRKIKVGDAVRNISIWLGLAALLVLGYAYQDEFRNIGRRIGGELAPGYGQTAGNRSLMITKSADGHFNVVGSANGMRLSFLIDTGATSIILSPADASRIGIDLSTLRYTTITQTANGLGRSAPYRLEELSVGPLTFRDVRVSINQADMSGSILGMSFLDRLNSYEVRGRQLILRY